MGKEIAIQVQETQRVSNRINSGQNTPRHILTKLMKIKHKKQILKAAREKQKITHRGIPIRIAAYLSLEILQARWEWQDILEVMKGGKKPKLQITVQITVPSKDLIQIWRRNQKLYRQAKAERIQYHQTSSSTNAKRSPLERKHRKGLWIRTQNNKANDSGIILINNYPKYKLLGH